MIEFKVNNKDYKIEFEHIKYNQCKCTISEILVPREKFQVIENGYAIMSKKDVATKTYCKSYGRKIALKKLLLKETSGFNKENRSEIWKKYFSVCKK